jgi:hypothetical protein
MARIQLLLAASCVAGLAACTPGDFTATTPVKPVASAPAVNPLQAVGSALQVRAEVADAQAGVWAADAQLTGIRGFAIDGAGVNSANDSSWVYTYRSASLKATATFTASPAGLKGPTPGPDAPLAQAVGTITLDSNDAVLRYKTIAKAKTLDRFNVSLQTSGGSSSWQVIVVDALGKTQEQGSVNASTGNVSIS